MEKRYIVYEEKETEMIMQLEKAFLKFAENYKVNHWMIPALIDGETLRKCGYFKTMPNQLTVTGHFSEEDCQRTDSDNLVKSHDCVNEGYYLTPAACIHFYPVIKERNIYNELITTCARVYRYEDGKYEQGKRLWDFGVREFVAVGSKEYVKAFLDDFKNKALKFAIQYSENVELCRANDHFYPTKENVIKEKIQKANNLKSELIVHIEGKKLAIASFNYHEHHFSKTFDFDNGGEIVTGCVGFGLDRWVTFMNSIQKEFANDYQ